MPNRNMKNNLLDNNLMKQRLDNVYSIIGENRMLVAVSKYHAPEDIKLCYGEGQRQFGESHVQELREKYEILPKDIEWHFIGHLQTNKVKYIADKVDMIQSLDRQSLAKRNNRNNVRGTEGKLSSK